MQDKRNDQLHDFQRCMRVAAVTLLDATILMEQLPDVLHREAVSSCKKCLEITRHVFTELEEFLKCQE